MSSYRVHLTSPKTYSTFLGDCGYIYNDPICGSVGITVPASQADSLEYPIISVHLTRSVVLRRRSAAKTRQRESGLLQIFQRRRSIQENPCLIEETPAEPHIETLVQCMLWQTPDHVQHLHDAGEVALKFKFAIPVEHLTLATTDTPMGSVSYAITATSRFPCGRTTTSTQPIEMLRRMIPDFRPDFHHFRHFLGEQLTMTLAITSEEPLGADTKALFTARLVAQQTITPGLRATEMRHVVVEQVRWWVQETVRVSAVSSICGAQDSIREIEQCVRRLCEGRQRGQWSATGGQRKIATTNDMIKIDFDIAIPATAHMAEELDISGYTINAEEPCQQQPSQECCSGVAKNDEQPAILVTHQLGVEIIAREDTIDQVTGRLVDRKLLQKSFCALVRLPIHEFARPEEIPAAIFQGGETPPLYDSTLQPPSYEFM